LETIELWWIRLEAPPLFGMPPAELLDASERRQAERFHFVRDRRRFMHAHAALRGVLAAHLGAEPSQVRFRRRPGGKPELDQPETARVRFNLSHSGELALLAISDRRDVGVDLERIRELPDRDAVAETVMTAAELREYEGLPEAARTEAFFTCWTRKEAFLKATGDGLFRDPRSIHAGIRPRSDPFPIGSGDVPAARWTAWPPDTPPAYAAALVVGGDACDIRCCTRTLPGGLLPKTVRIYR